MNGDMPLMTPSLDESPCGLFTTDPAGRVFWVNQRLCTWLGYSAERMVGTRWQDLLNVGGKIFAQTHIQPLLHMQGSVAEVKLDFIDSTDALLPMVLNAQRTERNGQVVYDMAVFIARDRDRYEREILLSRRRFEDMASAASREQEQALDRALFAEQMIGIVSHDLRNPLSAVRLGLRALQGHGLDEHQVTIAKRIDRSADRAGRLIAELLDFTAARLGTGIPIAPRTVDLHALVSELVEDLSPSFHFRLAHKPGESLGDAYVDPDRLAQLLGNLIANAGAYGAPEQPITITSSVADDHVSVTVHNHGTAIPDDIQPTLFKPMVRGEPASAQRSVGLGLYIVAEIAKAHGGAIRLQSTVEAGTSFTATFPHAPNAAKCLHDGVPQR